MTTSPLRPGSILTSAPVVLGMLVMVSSTAHADEESAALIEDFFAVESVYPQDEGETQITFSTGLVLDSPDGDSHSSQFGLEYGVTDRLQVEIGFSHWHERTVEEDGIENSHTGSGDFEAGLMYNLPRHDPDGLHVSFGLEITAPTGDVDRDLGDGFWVYEPFLIVAKDIGETAHLTFNIAYGFHQRDEYPVDPDEIEAETDELEVGLGYVLAFGHSWRGTLELSVETNEVRTVGDETEATVTAGLIYKDIDDVEMGIGFATGLTDDSDDWAVVASVSYEF